MPTLPSYLVTADGTCWHLRPTTLRILHALKPKTFITLLNQANDDHNWEAYKPLNLVQVYAFLLQHYASEATSPATIMEINRGKVKFYQSVLTYETIRETLEERDVLVPSSELFCNTTHNATGHANSVVLYPRAARRQRSAIAKSKQKPASDHLAREFDPFLEADNRTLHVSFNDHAWSEGSHSSHLHIVHSSASKVARFGWSRQAGAPSPSLAITFNSTSERDTAKTILEAADLEHGKKQFEISVYQRATNDNTIWAVAFESKHQNLHELYYVLREMLPCESYVPVYRLAEEEISKRGGLRIRTRSSPAWLLNLLPRPIKGREWRISGSEQISCYDCVMKGSTMGPAGIKRRKSARKAVKRVRFSGVPQVKVFDGAEDDAVEEDPSENVEGSVKVIKTTQGSSGAPCDAWTIVSDFHFP